MTVRDIPGFDQLSDHDKAEVLKFEAFLQRRHDKPDENVHHAYAETHGETVFEDAEYKIDPLCPTGECRGRCKPENHGL